MTWRIPALTEKEKKALAAPRLAPCAPALLLLLPPQQPGKAPARGRSRPAAAAPPAPICHPRPRPPFRPLSDRRAHRGRRREVGPDRRARQREVDLGALAPRHPYYRGLTARRTGGGVPATEQLGQVRWRERRDFSFRMHGVAGALLGRREHRLREAAACSYDGGRRHRYALVLIQPEYYSLKTSCTVLITLLWADWHIVNQMLAMRRTLAALQRQQCLQA